MITTDLIVTKAENRNNEKTNRGCVVFGSVESANVWLYRQESIVITFFSVKTASKKCGEEKKIAVTEIRIEYIRYPYKTGYNYGVSQLTFKKLNQSVKTESLRNKWTQNNPEKTCVQCIKCTAYSLKEACFGLVPLVTDKIFVLYRKTI